MTILFIIQKQVEQEAAQLEGFENFKNKSKFTNFKQLRYRQEIEMKFRNKEDIVKNEI